MRKHQGTCRYCIPSPIKSTSYGIHIIIFPKNFCVLLKNKFNCSRLWIALQRYTRTPLQRESGFLFRSTCRHWSVSLQNSAFCSVQYLIPLRSLKRVYSIAREIKHGNIKSFPHISSDKKSIIIETKQSWGILGSPHCTRSCIFQHQSAVHYEVSIKNWLRQAKSFLTSFALQPVKKFPAIERTQSFLIVFMTAHHVSLSWARLIQSTFFQRLSSRPISILPSYLSLDFQNVLFPPKFPNQNSVCTFLSTIHANVSLIQLFLTGIPAQYLVTSINHEFPLCVTSRIPLLPPPF